MIKSSITYAKVNSLETLDEIAAKQTDNECARSMQEAKDRLFKKVGAQGRGPMAGLT